MLEGVYNFCLPQILLKSSFQNLGLAVRGVSNKHCLLTFFIKIFVLSIFEWRLKTGFTVYVFGPKVLHNFLVQ